MKFAVPVVGALDAGKRGDTPASDAEDRLLVVDGGGLNVKTPRGEVAVNNDGLEFWSLSLPGSTGETSLCSEALTSCSELLERARTVTASESKSSSVSSLSDKTIVALDWNCNF